MYYLPIIHGQRRTVYEPKRVYGQFKADHTAYVSGSRMIKSGFKLLADAKDYFNFPAYPDTPSILSNVRQESYPSKFMFC
jgi:hypothetical protein